MNALQIMIGVIVFTTVISLGHVGYTDYNSNGVFENTDFTTSDTFENLTQNISGFVEEAKQPANIVDATTSLFDSIVGGVWTTVGTLGTTMSNIFDLIGTLVLNIAGILNLPVQGLEIITSAIGMIVSLIAVAMIWQFASGRTL
jgi:Flp pilus assembly pilin Flp